MELEMSDRTSRRQPHRAGFGSVAFVVLPGGAVAPADAAREVWESAVCAQVDPELFFPVVGQSPAAAKAVCAGCPVRELCLATFGPLVADGVVGGLTAHERRQLRRAERRAGERPAAA
jgi:WhiB family transcriptional regulator, redox-sensing transcriptional regulator